MRLLQGGGRWKADVLLLALDGCEIVVKDFAAKSPLVRALGRLQILHECRAYAHLAGCRGIPRFLGRVDAHALALARLPGEPLTATTRLADPRRYVDELVELTQALLARGFGHLDLRGRGNVWVDREGRPAVLDLAASLWMRPTARLFPLFRAAVRWQNRHAAGKWRTRLAPESLSPEDRAFLRLADTVRLFWIFNPKGAWKEFIGHHLRHAARIRTRAAA